METADRYFSQRYLLEHNLRVCLVNFVEEGLPGILEMAALEDSTPASLLDSYLEFLEGEYQDIHQDHFVTTIRNHITYLTNKYDDESDFLKHYIIITSYLFVRAVSTYLLTRFPRRTFL